jgi:hypothetical protein
MTTPATQKRASKAVRHLDMTVCVDDRALVCVDCLMHHANGDLSGYDGDPAELERMIAEHLNGRHVSIGWGREQHDCATDYTVIHTRADGEVDASDQRSGTAYPDDLDLPMLEIGDSLTIERHELQTVQEMGGDCECETYTFCSGRCDSCGQYIVGSYYAATLWGEVVNHD